MNTSLHASQSYRHISALSLGIWGIVIGYVIYQFILRVSLGVMAPGLMERFVINATEFSLLGSVFYFGYATMQIPVGVLLDYLGPKKTIPMFVILCVSGFCLFTFSENWTLVLIGRLLTGIGSAGAFISSLKVTHLLFSDQIFKVMVGITSALGLIGAVCGGLVGYLLEFLSLTAVLQGLSGIGIFLIILVVTSFSLKRTTALLSITEKDHSDRQEKESILTGIIALCKKPSLLFLMISVGLIAMSLYTFADSWGPSFLIQIHHLSMTQASTAIYLIYIGMVIGSACLSFVANRFNASPYLISTCGLILAGILITLLTCEIPYPLILGLMVIFGVCSSQQILFFGVILSLVPKKFGGVTTGVTNMLIMLLGSGSISLAGLLMDLADQPTLLDNGVSLYSKSSYLLAFGTIAVLVIGGVVLFSSISFFLHIKRKKEESLLLIS